MPDEPSAPSTSADPFDQRVRFGSFEILRTEEGKQFLLGKGAFGRTYKARHVFLERTVALKIINDKFLTDAKARERFLHEARAAAKLSHPHIAQVLDFGETDGILYYAMEYCSGGDLAAYVKRNGPLSVVQTVQIGLQVASALQCAHSVGFIHRDLKPANLMLASPDGPIVTKLIDFGLVVATPVEDAAPIDPDDMPTIEQRFIGTPLFASPEQLLVQPLDARSDFFALGMTLWFLILGTAPDQGTALTIQAERLKPDSYAPRLPRKLPQAFHTVIARLLEKRPENRFANATQLVAAFGKCAAGLGLPAGPSSSYVIGSGGSEEDSGPPEPAALESIAAPVEECHTLQGQRGANATGAYYEATSLSDRSTVWLHFLKPVIFSHAKMLERVRKNLGFLQHRPLTALVHPVALRAHTDRTIIVLEAPGGTDLLSASKAAGPIRLAEARPLLQAIASACDTLVAAGLPAPELEAHRIFLRQPSEFRTASAVLATSEPRLLPQFLARGEVAAIEGAAPAIDEPGWQYAALVYRLLSARNLPAQAVLTPEDCLSIPGLAEEANRLLAHAVARQLVHGTCSELLADLLIAEGLMGASVTRTHATAGAATTLSPAHTQNPGSSGTLSAPPPTTIQGSDSQLTAAPPPISPRTTQIAPPASPPPVSTAPPPVPLPPHERSAWPLIIAAVLLLLALAGGAVWMFLRPPTPIPPGSETVASLGAVSTLRLQGDLPAHAVARVGGREIPIDRGGDGPRVPFDGSATPLPATVMIEARGYSPLQIELASAADLERAHEASLKRSTGTLVFDEQGTDYETAVLRMVAKLPEEESFVDLEKYNRGMELKPEGGEKLPTGIYQVNLKGANEAIVRPRQFGRVTIKPDETTRCELPRSFANEFKGTLTPQKDGTPDGDPQPVSVVIEPGLSTGTYTEPGKRGPRQLALSEGRLDGEGTFLARILFSSAPDGDVSFDQNISLKRLDDGSVACETSEVTEENPPLESRLKRQYYPKSSFSAKGRLVPTK